MLADCVSTQCNTYSAAKCTQKFCKFLKFHTAKPHCTRADGDYTFIM